MDDHGNQLADNNGHIMETPGPTSSMELSLGTPSNGNAKFIILGEISRVIEAAWGKLCALGNLNFCRNGLWL